MSRFQSPTGEFARRGFDSPAAAARAWQRWAARIGTEPPVDLAAFEPVADRDQALDALERISATAPEVFGEIVSDPGWFHRMLLVLGGSSALAQTLVRHPEEARALAVPAQPRGARGWLDFFAERIAPVEGIARGNGDALRLANRVALIEIAARDLAASNPVAIVDDIAAELSHVADAVLEMSLCYARAEVPGWRHVRLAVIALGKTGGQELNYLSDVDVLYVAESTDTTGESLTTATKLAAAQARLCSAHTAEGSMWPVDAALRPEGKAGPLVRTLDSCRSYYETWAKNWEFQAMLKARPAAGDKELGEEFIELVRPMVWCAGERPEFLHEVRAMRERVVSLIPVKDVDREIKLGPGGLRDTEFSVQLLQLVHGRGDERLRLRGTIQALRELVRWGYIGRLDGADMEEAYRFQRVLEHRTQLRRLRRTHLFPTDETAVVHIARSMGVDAETLSRLWRESARRVLRLQQRIFFSPLLDAVCQVPVEGLRLSAEAAQTRMRALGFTDPRSALGSLETLTRGTDRRADIQRQLMPAMLGWLALGPNPDFGLLSFRQLSEALGSSSWYLRALRDEGYMAHRLAMVCSTSRYSVDLLKRSPDMIRMLANTGELRPRNASELADAMTRAADRHDDPDQAAASIRALRRLELCRIALADVLGPKDLAVTGRALSDLTSATLDAALSLARRDIDAPQVAVVALGRWGAMEMSYSSDADCMVVAPEAEQDAGLTAAANLMRRVSAIVGAPGPDPALTIDTGLRPEGKGGPPVRTISSYGAYYEKWSSMWEAQMLLKARHGAGSSELTGELIKRLDQVRYPGGGLSTSQVAEIRKLKARMERERIPRGVPRERHLKLGPGGLSDVEWTVQLMQLRHAHEHPELRRTSTLPTLRLLVELGLMPTHLADRLKGAWRRASMLRDAIMLVRGRAGDVLPGDTRELASIATLVGFPAAETSRLIEDTRRQLRLAHDAVGVLFWRDESGGSEPGG